MGVDGFEEPETELLRVLAPTGLNKKTAMNGGVFFGDPYGTRTRVAAVKGRSPNR